MSALLRELASLVADGLRPLEDALAEPGKLRALALRFGWRATEIPPAWAALGDPLRRLLAAVDGLGDDPALAEITDALSAAEDLRTQLAGLTVAPPGVDRDVFLADMRELLVERLVIDQLARRASTAFTLAQLFGFVTVEPGSPEGERMPHVRYRVDPGRLAALIGDPGALPETVFGWGTENFDADWLTGLLFELLARLQLPARLERGSDAGEIVGGIPVAGTLIRVPLVDRGGSSPLRLGFLVAVLPADAGGPGLVIAPWIPVLEGAGLALGPDATLRARAGDGQPIELALVITPAGVDVRFPGSGGSLPDGGIGLELGAKTALRLGTATGTRFELDGVKLGVFVDHDAEGFSANAELALDGARFMLAGGDQDGIVGKLLGGRETRVPVPIALRWSSRDGFSLALAAGTLGVPSTITLGPVRFDRTQLALGANDGEIEAAITSTVTAALGPVTLQLDRLGGRVRLDRTVPGALGFGGFDAGIVWPTGGGVTIAAGIVVGAGHVTRDPVTGGYAGGLELSLFEIEASGVVVLDRKTPEGQDLTSCVALVSARFPGIPIGLGFTLEGIGGLFALNRRIDVDRARVAARGGALAALLSPSDPAHGMAGVIDRLRELFPVAAGRHVAGPSVRIGWGSPQMLVADVIVLVEAPAPIRIVMLGTATVGLPTLERMIVELHIDAIGVLDLGRGTLALDASLHDSRIAGYELTGDLALRMGWGADKHFLAALGGFHPAFRPPAGFPTLRRLALTIGDNPSLRLEAYLALTSNSVQVGARVDLDYHTSGLKIGGHLEFDALFELRPFHVETEISAGVSISYRGHNIASASLDFTLIGPRPWRAHGSATIGILWWDVSVGFDVTWGDPTQPVLPPPPDPGEVLRQALADHDAWRGELPAGERAWIALRDRTGEHDLAIHPFAELVVRQRAVPLDHPITQFGSAPLASPRRFAITTVHVGTTLVTVTEPTREQFAPGQFAGLTQDERLSAPSFEDMAAGVRFGRDAVGLGATARASMAYDTDVDDPLAPPAVPPKRGVSMELLGVLVAQRAPTRTPVRPATIFVHPVRYAIASADDLTVDGDSAAVAAGQTSYATLRDSIRVQPLGVRRRLQVVPATEL